MKNLFIIVSFLFFGFFLISCEFKQVNDKPELSFTTIQYSKKTGDCLSEKKRCFEIDISFPKAEGGVDSAKTGINRYIEQLVLESIHFEEYATLSNSISIDSAVWELEEEFKDLLEDAGDYPMGWYLDLKGTVAYRDSIWISFDVSSSEFLGGAHPNSYVSKAIFNLKTGKRAELDNLIENKSELLKIAERKFREIRKIPAEQSLSEAGYWFDDDQFALAEAFGLTDSGIEFYYNPYEIAPYAFGETTINIAWAELGKK